MKLKNLLVTSSIVSLFGPVGFGAAIAQEYVYDTIVRLGGNQKVFIEANNDAVGNDENVFISVAKQNQMTISKDGTEIFDSLSVSGAASVSANLAVSGVISNPSNSNDGQLTIGDNLKVTGWSNLEGEVYITGDTRINNGSSLAVDRIVDSGGDNLVRLDDSLIISGPPSSTPGEGETAQTYALRVDGYSDLDATNILGVATINTTGSATTTIGNSDTSSVVSMTGGSSRVVLENLKTSINTLGGAANTFIGGAGNTTSILSTSTIVGHHTTASSVAVGTGTAANNISIGNGVIGSVISATAGNTSMLMKAGSIRNTVLGSSEGVSGSTVIANNGSERWVADANGKLISSDDETSGTSAALVVTNSAGKTHGVVVEETKTTISGGTNSSSLTFADNGATFSDTATGQPIQVHGVADGTADFDAVNVRQLYSGLAAVLAATPEINLEPGKSGMGIGLGGYGGFEAIGVGFGHMYDNGAIVKVSVSKAAHSEVAVRAGVSWNW